MKTKKIAGIFFILILSLCFILELSSADEIRMPTGNEIVPLTRGESSGILMSSNKMYTLYYVADGKPATLQYSQPFFAFFAGKMPVVAMSVYYAPWFDKKYTLVKNTGIDIIARKINLPQKAGVYKFEFKTYGPSQTPPSYKDADKCADKLGLCYEGSWAAVNFKVLY